VTVSDTKSGDELRNEIPVLLDHGITVETGGHGDRTFRGQDLIVVSPGVPVDAPPLVQARAAGETVIGEIELAAQFLPGPIVAITGSNGKTTTTSLTGEIMTAAGFPALVGGNIGTPAISLAEGAKPETVIVLEVSSFQLETIQSFPAESCGSVERHAQIISTGIARLKSMLMRRPASSKISREATSPCSTPTIPICVAMAARTRAQVFWFSRQKEVRQGAWVRDGNILFRDAGEPKTSQREIMQVSEIPLKGAHNLENVLAAVSAGLLMGCAPEKIREAVRDFKAVEHRLEFVATIGASITTTIQKRPTLMRPSRRWNRSRRTST
jgi:UDP-N-acetylmuramoylalanine--D-glutamate ligase